MSIRRKGRRTIVVRGAVYYWHLFGNTYLPEGYMTKKEDYECKRIHTLRIESADFRHRHLVVNVHGTVMMNAYFLQTYGDLIIKPGMVRRFIEAALDSGWNPATAQEHFVLENAEELIEA